MPIPVNISSLINREVVESTRIEFKENWNPEAILHTICAFANDIDNMGGGYIVVGVKEENGIPLIPITGLDINKIDEMEKELREICHHLEPFYQPVAEPLIYQGKHILLIWVSGGYGRPYKASVSLSSKGSEKKYYIRKSSNTVIATPTEEKRLYSISETIPFDDRENLYADINDLDIGLIRDHLRKIGSNLYDYSKNYDLVDLCKDLQIVSGPTENIRPKNVGLLMFSEHPEKYFKYARIELVDIPDPTGNNMTEKIFTGPIQRQLQDVLLYIKNYVVKEIVIKNKSKAEAERYMNYPYDAIEEIVTNAVYHKSYQINEPITIRITQNSIEVTSFPGFDSTITDEKIKKYEIKSMIYRNRKIGDFLKELKLTEGRNTGYPTVFKSLKENHSPLPVFEMDKDRGYLTVILRINPLFEQKNNSVDYENKILRILSKKELSMTDLSKEMGYKGITKKLSSTIDYMIKTKKIEKIISTSNAILLRKI